MRKLLFSIIFLSGGALAQQAENAPGGVLRALDKLSGDTVDMTLSSGQSAVLGDLQIVMRECRYPAGNPSGDAYAALEISEMGSSGVLFSGWMIASAPALSSLEHRRYDLWVMRCTTS